MGENISLLYGCLRAVSVLDIREVTVCSFNYSEKEHDLRHFPSIQTQKAPVRWFYVA